jgi:hypothetical protein
MAEADRCLYHAKAEGRNRVMTTERKPAVAAPPLAVPDARLATQIA